MKIQRAFTLIELLVVIAIIAILAAILFPVFAQAKAAAKATAALSNTKQLTLACIMYEGDVDDSLPLGTSWNTGNDELCFGAGKCFSTWAWNTSPYVKSINLLGDPSGPPNQNYFNWGMTVSTTLSPSFGYNYEFLSPVNLTSSTIATVSATAAVQPADTVMLTSKWIHTDQSNWTNGSIWYVNPLPGGMMMDAASEGVECGSLAQNCATDWGIGGGFDTGGVNLTSLTEGRYTAGNAYRVGGQITVSFLDGHAKRMTPGALAVGTNFNINAPEGQPGSNGYITITSASKYLWSTTKDCSDFTYGPCFP